MAGKASRDKGIRGENEFCKMLHKLLGDIYPAIERNVDQDRKSGADILVIDGWAIQVKRYKDTPNISGWWRQTLNEAYEAELKPCLAYRLNRQPWSVLIPIGLLNRQLERPYNDRARLVQLTLVGFSDLIRLEFNNRSLLL